MVSFQQINVTDPFGFAAIRCGNYIIYVTSLLLNCIRAMLLSMQGFSRHRHQDQNLITRLKCAEAGTAIIPNFGLGPFLSSLDTCLLYTSDAADE